MIGHSTTAFILLIVLDILLPHLRLFNKLVPAITFCTLFHARKSRLVNYRNPVFDKDVSDCRNRDLKPLPRVKGLTI